MKRFLALFFLFALCALSASAEEPSITPGTETYEGFLMDNVLHDGAEGDIHYHLYVPDGEGPFALLVTLPGYEGLYFQGMGVNLRAEAFAFEARRLVPDMIVAAPQLNDWGETSARQTVALTEYLLSHERIDPARVYIEGYSGGGETLSLALGMRPELYAAALHCSSQWDGDLAPVAEKRTPVYFAIGEDDEYYTSAPAKEACAQLRALYAAQGLAQDEIDALVVLDVKDADYFARQGVSNQHGGGGLFARDEAIMGWLFSHTR